MKEEKYLKNLVDQSKKVFLTDKEKQIMKSEVLGFIKKHPIQETSMNWLSWPAFKMPVLRYAPVMAVLTVVVTFGVSYAANYALPGDALYPIKVGVNEKVLGLLYISDESKAKYDVELAQLRLEEIEKIANKYKLDERTKGKISDLLNGHIERVQKFSDKIKNDSNPELSLKIDSELEASLNAHKEILDELSKNKDSQFSDNVKEVLSNVNNKVKSIKKNRQNNESSFVSKSFLNNNQLIVEGKLNAIENKINEVKKLIEANKDSMGEESYKAAVENLNSAEHMVLDAKDKLNKGEYGEAFLIFQRAMRVAQETKISAKASINFKINVPKVKESDDKDRIDDKDSNRRKE